VIRELKVLQYQIPIALVLSTRSAALLQREIRWLWHDLLLTIKAGYYSPPCIFKGLLYLITFPGIKAGIQDSSTKSWDGIPCLPPSCWSSCWSYYLARKYQALQKETNQTAFIISTDLHSLFYFKKQEKRKKERKKQRLFIFWNDINFWRHGVGIMRGNRPSPHDQIIIQRR